MKKKLPLCLVLTVLLSLLLQTQATCLTSGKTKITARTLLPTIEVVVPTTGQVYINPTRLSINLGHKIDNGQIISTPSAIENQSEVPVKVNADVTCTIKSGSNIQLESSSTAGSSSQEKKAFIYFEIQATSDPETVSWDGAYNAAKHMLIQPGTQSRKELTTLAAGDGGKRYGAFRLTGDCIASPESPWKTTDGVKLNIAFTFTPSATPDNP